MMVFDIDLSIDEQNSWELKISQNYVDSREIPAQGRRDENKPCVYQLETSA